MRWFGAVLGALAAGAPERLRREAWKSRCGVAAVDRGGAAPVKAVAVVLWGESFRNSRHRGDRGRCGAESLLAQNAIRVMHVVLFERLAALGYASAVVGATSHCGSGRGPLDAAAVLAAWYRPRLLAPILAIPAAAKNGALKSRLYALRVLRGVDANYSHVLSLRWDLEVDAAVLPPCWLDSGALLDSQVLGGHGDWDRAVLAPRAYVDAWTCLLELDVPWLEPNGTCAPDAGTNAAGRGLGPTTCACDPGFVGAAPPGLCWRRRCGWDVCLNAFPSAVRRPPLGCAQNASAFGDKLHHGRKDRHRWRTLPAVKPSDWDALPAVASSRAVARWRAGAGADVACVDDGEDDFAAPGDVLLAARCVGHGIS